MNGAVSLLASLTLLVLLRLLECRGFVVDRQPPRRPTQRSASQLLEFIEPTTGVKVQLVGAMHYNPASIQLTADTIHQLAAVDQLGSVLIESCDLRWNSTLALNPTLASLLKSEMRTAYQLAVDYGRPVVLGDQRINVTLSRLASGLRETAQDLCLPFSGGWQSIAGNLTQARQEAVPLGDDYLGLFSFLEPKLMLAAPASFLKYPLSYFIRAPLSTALFFALVFWVDTSSAATIMTDGASIEPVSTADLVASLAGSTLEIVLLARIFLKELLAERNLVLARNILEQCRYYQRQPQWQQGWLLNSWRRRSSQATYAEGSVRPHYDSSSEKTVVAVLGMAHCNGIRKLLEEQKV